MLSVRFHEFGDPLSVLKLEEVPAPQPAPNEVIIRLRARSINPSDLLAVRGIYGILPTLPATPGLEGTGVIAAVGTDVHDVKPGQRVVPLGVRGTWQESVAATRDRVLAIPDSVSDSSAAQLMINPLSAWIMVVDDLQLEPDEWLVQTAASSTLGRIVIQIARMRGFRTINVVRRREQIDDVRSIGGDEVIASDDEDVSARILEITGGAGSGKAIDAVGGETGSAVLRALAPDGTMLVYGALSMKPTLMEGSRMIFSTTSVRGFWLSKWKRAAAPDAVRATIARVLAAMESGDIVPPVEAEYALTDFAGAIAHVKTSGRRGKVLLTG